MGDRRWRQSLTLWVFRPSVRAFLPSDAAFAQIPITDYVVVQPIDVCSNSTPTVCPVVNSLGQTALTSPGTTQIGFIDPVTGVNISDAVWSQAGIRVTFLPLVQYNSAKNPLGNLFQPDYRWLHVINCSTCGTGSSSNDFLTLSQQPSISRGTVPSPTNPAGVPVNSNLTTVNMFFVNTIVPPAGELTIKGFSWDNGNGSAIASSTVFTAPLGSDTITHELGHVLGLEHSIFSAGPLTCPAPYPNSFCSENLMTAGSAVRQVPSGLVNCGTNMKQACWVAQVPPQHTMQPNALDLMTTGGTCTIANPSACPSQQAAVLLSGFMNPIPSSTTTATDPDNSNSITYHLTGATGGRINPQETLVAEVIMLPPSAPQIGSVVDHPSRESLLQDIDYPNLDEDNNPGNPYYFGKQQTSECSAETTQCVIIEFNSPGAGPKDSVNVQVSFEAEGGVTNASLCGTEITYVFNDGLITTSPLPCSASTVATTSQMPDLTFQSEIASPTTFVGANTTACTPLPDGQTCPNPMTTGISDSNPATGVESAKICYRFGNVVPCP